MTNKDKIKRILFYFFIKMWNAQINLTGLWLFITRLVLYFVICPFAFFLDLAILILAIAYLLLNFILEFIFKHFFAPLLKKLAATTIKLILYFFKISLTAASVLILYYRFHEVKYLVINLFDKLI